MQIAGAHPLFSLRDFFRQPNRAANEAPGTVAIRQTSHDPDSKPSELWVYDRSARTADRVATSLESTSDL